MKSPLSLTPPVGVQVSYTVIIRTGGAAAPCPPDHHAIGVNSHCFGVKFRSKVLGETTGYTLIY